jgi:hypothetical protein
MSYTLQNFIDDVRRRVSDDSDGSADTPSIVSYLNEGLRRIRRKYDIPTSEEVSQLTVFNDIFSYAIPTGYKGYVRLSDQDRMNDLLNFKYTSDDDFWRNYPAGNKIAEARDGESRKILVNISDPQLSSILLNNCDTYNGNGTWTANTTTSDATGVATDHLQVWEGTGSVKFNIDVSQSASDYAEIYNSGLNAVDLSGDSVVGIGTLTCMVWLPSSTAFTGFTVRWGSSASVYYESTVTTQLDGAAFKQGWNTLGFSWATATTTGTPTDSAIDYLLFRATYAATMTDQTGLRVDAFYMRQPMMLDLHYSTDYLVIDGTTGSPKESFASSLDTSSYFSCDPSFTDWLLYHTLQNVFTYLVRDQMAYQLNDLRLQEAQQDLERRFPSKVPPLTYAYMDTDDIQDATN